MITKRWQVVDACRTAFAWAAYHPLRVRERWWSGGIVVRFAKDAEGRIPLRVLVVWHLGGTSIACNGDFTEWSPEQPDR
jgi:hypothetical protein